MQARKIIITGGSGFIGSAIARKLVDQGFSVVSLDIAPPQNDAVVYADVNLLQDNLKQDVLKNPYAVVNLAGKSIFGRWTDTFKQLVYDTRVVGTSNLVQLFVNEPYRPEVFVSASAAGFYGDRGDNEVTATSRPGEGFLARVSRDWEQAAREAEHLDIPTTIIRNGHVLGRGGLLKVLLPYYRWGLGGPLGSGRQWFPWIHREDTAALYLQVIKAGDSPDTVNAVAPETLRNQEFSRTLAEVLSRPHLLRIPEFALKLLYGQFGEEMLYSQKVISKVDDKLDFSYQYPDAHQALADSIQNG